MVVTYALRKEEMRRQGDELDAKLRKANIELHALGNTLALVRQRQRVQRLGRDVKPTCMYASTTSKKGKVFPYSLSSVGPRADPGVQAVSPQVT